MDSLADLTLVSFVTLYPNWRVLRWTPPFVCILCYQKRTLCQALPPSLPGRALDPRLSMCATVNLLSEVLLRVRVLSSTFQGGETSISNVEAKDNPLLRKVIEGWAGSAVLLRECSRLGFDTRAYECNPYPDLHVLESDLDNSEVQKEFYDDICAPRVFQLHMVFRV